MGAIAESKMVKMFFCSDMKKNKYNEAFSYLSFHVQKQLKILDNLKQKTANNLNKKETF